MTDPLELFAATQSLFRAFNYLHPRMKGGSLAPPEPMNAEALAGCILHACMSRLLRELQMQRAEARRNRPGPASGWIVRPRIESQATK